MVIDDKSAEDRQESAFVWGYVAGCGFSFLIYLLVILALRAAC